MTLQEGTRFGDYEAISILGAGACAEVWLADKVGLGDFRRRVAIKILKDDRRDDAEMFEALQLEARICAQLDHPNIVQVIAVETLGHNLAVVMEYVSGGTLKDFIQRSVRLQMPIPTSICLSLGRDIASGLAHAHSSPGTLTGPVIHRDLKPANVLIDESTAARIADFGIAKVIGEVTSTETGLFKGTPAYSAPEVWEDERNFSSATDLFSLGCILYELIMMKRLFGARSVPGIFGQIAKGDPVEEAAPVEELMPGMVPILVRLLQRDPAKRMRSAFELVEALDALSAALVEAPEPWLYEELVVALDPPTQSDELMDEWSPPVLPPSLPDEWMRLAAKALPSADNDPFGAAETVVAEPRQLPERSPSRGGVGPRIAKAGSPSDFSPQGSTVHVGPRQEDGDSALPFSATVTAALLFALLAATIALTMIDCS